MPTSMHIAIIALSVESLYQVGGSCVVICFNSRHQLHYVDFYLSYMVSLSSALGTVATEVRHKHAQIKCARAREKGIENRGSYE